MRRGLWKNDQYDEFKSEWNQLLLQNVLSTAYVEALKFIRSQVLFQDKSVMHTETGIIDSLRTFESFFPLAKEAKDSNWKFLVRSVLERIVFNEEVLFPVSQEHIERDCKKVYTLKFESFYREGHAFPVYFTRAETETSITDPLLNLLRATGMKITCLSPALQQSFEECKILINMLNPDSVITFLKSFDSSKADKSKVDKIPCNIEETIFKSIANVNTVLDFCSKCETFESELSGLPLLVTNDCVLRCFERSSPVFCSEYVGLFPNSAKLFVHEKQISTLRELHIEKYSVTSEFQLQNVADLLPSHMDIHRYTRLDAIDWDPSTFVFPNEFWIRTLWKYLGESFDSYKALNADASVEDFLKPLENVCLIPAYKGGTSHVLVKLRKMYKILYRETFASVTSLDQALKGILIPYLNTRLLSGHSLMLVAPRIGRADNPVSVLECLNKYKEQIRRTEISETECCAILAYFAENLNSMLEHRDTEQTWVSTSLKCLPLFVTKEGNRRSFETQDCKVLVLPEGIPEDGLEQWAYSTGTVLLRYEPKLEELHRFLGFAYTNHIDVYIEHILQYWDSLPDSAIIVHLKYMKNQLLPSLCEELSEPQKRMLEILTVLPVIADTNGRRKVSEYISPHHPVLNMMCRVEEFPPKSFCEEEWKKFLELIGLKHEMSSDLYIRFATEIAAEGRNKITEKSALKSKTLIEYLFLHPLEEEPWFYQDISFINFVVPDIIDTNYSIVHSQYSIPDYFISFHKAITSDHLKLAWSTLPLLPDWADPSQYYNQENKMQLLGIYDEPPIGSVIKHTQNVCESLQHMFESNKGKKKKVSLSWINLLFDKLYGFLQWKGLSSALTRQKLFSFPVVFIPEANIFVPAHQIIEDLLPEQEIRPYLFRAPSRFGKFLKLFSYLGAAKTPSFLHYVKVLSMIKDEVQDSELTEEYLSAWGAIRVALENLFCLLSPVMQDNLKTSAREIPQGTVLYLPSRRKHMVNSTQLTIADNGYYEQRLSGDVDFDFLMDLKTLKLSHTIMTARWLPEVIRPKFLTDSVIEKVDISAMTVVQTCAKAIKLEAFLHCGDFLEGVLRLWKHFKAEDQMNVPYKLEQVNASNKPEKTIADRIQNTRIKQVLGLKTYLHLNGVKIEGSMRSKECFMSEPKNGSIDRQIWINFLNEFESDFEFIQSLDEYLIGYIHFVIDFKLPEHLIMRLFHKMNDPSGIRLMLDKIPIAPYHLPAAVLMPVFPEPGTYVPVELHHLLNCDFTEFMPQDYHCVALELEDAEMFDNNDITDSYTPVYIYVRIEQRVRTDSDVSVICQNFEVFTGSEVVVVPAFKIYKFVRPRRIATCNAVVDAQILPEPMRNQSPREVFCSVRHQLEEAWTLPEDDRRHIIKRLYLKWHPDKNPGNEQFCSEIFRYIKYVIYKLENGISLDGIEDIDGSSRQSRANSDFTASHYFTFCERMNNRSRSHRDQAQTFYMPDRPYSGGSAEYGADFIHRSFCNQPCPDFGEARRWQRQAMVDLRNAFETIDTRGDPPAYNWICYMCHQVLIGSFKFSALVELWPKTDRRAA